jgi:hypothetical protein
VSYVLPTGTIIIGRVRSLFVAAARRRATARVVTPGRSPRHAGNRVVRGAARLGGENAGDPVKGLRNPSGTRSAAGRDRLQTSVTSFELWGSDARHAARAVLVVTKPSWNAR